MRARVDYSERRALIACLADRTACGALCILEVLRWAAICKRNLVNYNYAYLRHITNVVHDAADCAQAFVTLR